MENKKQILDACCGSRMFWFDKREPHTLFCDIREYDKGFIDNRQNRELHPDKIIKLMGDLPRIELFARKKTEGWDVWGNEVKSDIELNNGNNGIPPNNKLLGILPMII